MTGKLIAFTGLDCAGKTSSIRAIKVGLEQRAINAAIFENHSPFSAYWNVYKKIAKNCKQDDRLIPYEIDRFMQAFELCINCEEVLPQLLRDYNVVLSDRYIIDKIIYGQLRGQQDLAENALATIQTQPDFTLFLDVSVETAIKRIANKGGPEDWKEEPEMLKKAYAVYQTMLTQSGHPIVRICAEKPLIQVVEDCMNEILKIV